MINDKLVLLGLLNFQYTVWVQKGHDMHILRLCSGLPCYKIEIFLEYRRKQMGS